MQCFLRLQIQIRVGETIGTPMLGCQEIACVRLELGADFSAPGPVFERLPATMRPFEWRNVSHSRLDDIADAAMENRDTGFSSRFKNLHHVNATLVTFGNCFYSISYFAALRDEVVIRIDQDEPYGLLLIGELWRFPSRSCSTL